MTEVEMVYTKKEMLVVAVMVLCSVMADLSFADATADSIMLRRKPVASAVPKQVAQETHVQPVAVETVEAPSPEEKPTESVQAADVSVEKSVTEEPASDAAEKKIEKKEKKAPPRDAVITADRTDYDRKEGVVLFDRNVYVDDAQYQMHADRVYLFLEGTNELKRIVAIGNVAMTNEARRAYGAKATYSKKNGLVVLHSGDGITAEVRDESKEQPQIVRGKRIRFWVGAEQVEVDEADLTGAAPAGGADSLKKALGK